MKKRLILLVASLGMLFAATAWAVAQTQSSNGVQGYITNISGAVVLVEENPADEGGSGKGAFTVTDQTEIYWQQGEELIPATFDELGVGQLVAAEYTGPVAESYPSQGTAGSIVILEEPYQGERFLQGNTGDDLICMIPEGCDTDRDGVPDLMAGEPVAGDRMSTGFEQYAA